MKVFEQLSDVQLLALCIYGEARNQGLDGMLAVGSVVMNRAKRGGWWGDDIKSVILKRWQFSCFNEGDPNRKRLEIIARDFHSHMNRSSLKQALWIAMGIVEDFLDGNVGGATHYHTTAISPSWRDDLQFIKQVGDHLFYQEG